MSNAIIELDDVSKVFLTDELETHALSNVSLTIERGDYVSISGPSGCGKSTLLSVLGLLDTANGGRYVLDQKDVSALSRNERAHIRNARVGFVFQSFNLIGNLTVWENVELPLTYRDDLGRQQVKEMVDAALEKVDMAHRGLHYPSQLSGGQQQRVAVARAVAGDPAILLADEPTGNLDTRNAEAVMLLLDQLHAGGATICMVTHDPRSAERARRNIEMLDGRVLAEHGSELNTATA